LRKLGCRWDTEKPASFERLSADSMVTVRMFDKKGRNSLSLLGENTISCSRLKVDKPLYVWLPLLPSVKHKILLGMRKKREMPNTGAEVEETPELQVGVAPER
jgi:hypothetical protein